MTDGELHGRVPPGAANREDLIGRIWRRISMSFAARDSGAALADEAVGEAVALLEVVLEPARDIEVARVLGWWHFVRYLRLPVGEDQQDLDAALTYLEPVYRADPDGVPGEVLLHFREVVRGRRHERALQLLRATLQGREDAGAEAVRLLRKPGLGYLLLTDLRDHHVEHLYAAIRQVGCDQAGRRPSPVLVRLLEVRRDDTCAGTGRVRRLRE